MPPLDERRLKEHLRMFRRDAPLRAASALLLLWLHRYDERKGHRFDRRIFHNAEQYLAAFLSTGRAA